MTVTITAVSSPRYSAPDHSTIDCVISIEHLGTPRKYAGVPFTAAAHDPEPHGRQLFDELVAGEHGAVAPYTPSVA